MRVLAMVMTFLGLAIVWYCSTRFAWLHWRMWTRDAWSVVGVAVGAAAVASLARARFTRALAVGGVLVILLYGVTWLLVGSAGENFRWDSTAISWLASLGYAAVVAGLLMARLGQLASAIVAVSFLVVTIQHVIDLIDVLRVLSLSQIRSEAWLIVLGLLLVTLGAAAGIAVRSPAHTERPPG